MISAGIHSPKKRGLIVLFQINDHSLVTENINEQKSFQVMLSRIFDSPFELEGQSFEHLYRISDLFIYTRSLTFSSSDPHGISQCPFTFQRILSLPLPLRPSTTNTTIPQDGFLFCICVISFCSPWDFFVLV